MASKVVGYNIVNGPSKWDLMLSLFDSRNGPRTVKFIGRLMTTAAGGNILFTYKEEEELEVVINSVSKEDGSGESWNFYGYAKTFLNLNMQAVKGHFRTDKRIGFLEKT